MRLRPDTQMQMLRMRVRPRVRPPIPSDRRIVDPPVPNDVLDTRIIRSHQGSHELMHVRSYTRIMQETARSNNPNPVVLHMGVMVASTRRATRITDRHERCLASIRGVQEVLVY